MKPTIERTSPLEVCQPRTGKYEKFVRSGPLQGRRVDGDGVDDGRLDRGWTNGLDRRRLGARRARRGFRRFYLLQRARLRRDVSADRLGVLGSQELRPADHAVRLERAVDDDAPPQRGA